MGYASKSGRARTNSRSPQAHAICDRCGFRHNHVNLKWQYDWRGASLANTRLLVCSSCYDAPQQQLRSIVIPADPMPIQNPRTQDFVTAGSNFRFGDVIRFWRNIDRLGSASPPLPEEPHGLRRPNGPNALLSRSAGQRPKCKQTISVTILGGFWKDFW